MGYHQDAWNQVLLGSKRWTIYPESTPSGGGVPAEAVKMKPKGTKNIYQNRH